MTTPPLPDTQSDLFVGHSTPPESTPGGAFSARMNGKPAFDVPAKTALNLKSGFAHKKLCDGPTFSTGDACAYKCAFCYVPDMFRKLNRVSTILQREGLRHEDVVIRRRNALDILRGELLYADGRPRFDGPDEVGRVVYSSPSVDVAANPELCAETVEAVALILRYTPWHVRLLSKSNLLPRIARALQEHHAGLGPRSRVIYGVSTGTLDDGLAKVFEERTPLVSKRVASLHWLQDHGYRTYGMVCPSLPLPDGNYSRFAREMSEVIRAERCEHVWAEVINVRGESMTRTIAALQSGGFDDYANALARTMADKRAWEDYARATFAAHASLYPPGKLRFLQYVSAGTRSYWQAREDRGAVLL